LQPDSDEIQLLRRATPAASTTWLPIGGIWTSGSRLPARARITELSGKPGAMSLAPVNPSVPRLGSTLQVLVAASDADAIKFIDTGVGPFGRWHIEQFVCSQARALEPRLSVPAGSESFGCALGSLIWGVSIAIVGALKVVSWFAVRPV